MAIARAPRLPFLHLLYAGLLAFVLASPAKAELSDLFGPQSIAVTGDLRFVAADGEKSWTDAGFGKGRFGGTDDLDWKLRPVLTEAELIWQPRFSWSLSGTVVAAAQHEQQNAVDLIEAFLSFKPLPHGGTHLSGRAGLMWPQISLEHEGAGWQVADMITPSAINSWIGEEVKVVGVEATVAQDIGANQVSGTIGIFGFNDTAGTLLSFRGWALHDLKATAFGKQQLPELDPIWEYAQAPRTKPLLELDDRPGFYGRVAFRMAAPITLSLFYYQNRGVPEAVTPTLQWGWDTRFWNLGARIDLSEDTKILAQALTGTTEMGFEHGGLYWVETRYRSAYLRLSHRTGDVTLSGRFDWFNTRERGTWMDPGESEDGWAGTIAADWNITTHIDLLGEILHLDSDRGTRMRMGLDPNQKQTIVQLAARFGF
jgi:hypothetical protein